MANHNPGARAFLLIVLGGIVIGFVIAVFLLGGNETETAVETPAATEQPAEAPAAAAEEPTDDAAMSDDMSPPDTMPDDAMADDLSPPDTMPAEAMSDEAPDAMMPEENSEAPVTETPAPAPNP